MVDGSEAQTPIATITTLCAICCDTSQQAISYNIQYQSFAMEDDSQSVG